MNFWLWVLAGFGALAALFYLGYRRFYCSSCCFMAAVVLSIFLFSYVAVETGFYVPPAPTGRVVVASVQPEPEQAQAPVASTEKPLVVAALAPQVPARAAPKAAAHAPRKVSYRPKAEPACAVAREPDLADRLWREGDIVLEDCDCH